MLAFRAALLDLCSRDLVRISQHRLDANDSPQLRSINGNSPMQSSKAVNTRKSASQRCSVTWPFANRALTEEVRYPPSSWPPDRSEPE